jgi:glycine betaine catabolism B
LVLLYGNNKADEIAYTDVFDRAEREIGMKTVYAVTNAEGADTNMHRGFIDAALITREVPDFKERTFYISGPRVMVVKFQSVLKDLGVAHSKIKVDFFPGFA